jgi:hypothetical protein
VVAIKSQAKHPLPRLCIWAAGHESFLTIITKELTINFEEDFDYPG